MQEKQRQRAVTAFQDFLNTPLETLLEQHQHVSSQASALAHCSTLLQPQFPPTKPS